LLWVVNVRSQRRQTRLTVFRLATPLHAREQWTRTPARSSHGLTSKLTLHTGQVRPILWRCAIPRHAGEQ
jgi:hypothetical protein